ncbi:nucleoside hydrolase [Kushneria aurantia]|uniref:Nucleoside hydrolase n=1 Tax=Kushneria aurantia TaxID=504092 RepID=A0ABV6G469_9GAMM|nr:nucleoside hydrolase [Kushneria aurantia]
MTTQPIIFDTDPGVDDAQAIALIMADPDIEVVGMTTTFGNVRVATATHNALLLAELGGQPQIPVAQGADYPLSKTPYPVPTFIHGDDGLGNQPLPTPSGQPDARNAAQFLIDKTLERPGEISLVAVGPLGNLAMALALDPDIVNRVKQVIIMGGSAGRGGNVTPVAEANIFNDPHAARKVLTAGWPLTMVGLDVTLETVITPERMARIAAAQNEDLGRVLSKSYDFYADFYRNNVGLDGCCPHDSCAVAFLKHPELFTTVEGHLDVITEGIGEGQTIFAPAGQPYVSDRWSQNPLVKVCMGVDGNAVVDWIEQTLAG